MESAERKLWDFDPLPDADNAVVGSHECGILAGVIRCGNSCFLYAVYWGHHLISHKITMLNKKGD